MGIKDEKDKNNYTFIDGDDQNTWSTQISVSKKSLDLSALNESKSYDGSTFRYELSKNADLKLQLCSNSEGTLHTFKTSYVETNGVHPAIYTIDKLITDIEIFDGETNVTSNYDIKTTGMQLTISVRGIVDDDITNKVTKRYDATEPDIEFTLFKEIAVSITGTKLETSKNQEVEYGGKKYNVNVGFGYKNGIEIIPMSYKYAGTYVVTLTSTELFNGTI